MKIDLFEFARQHRSVSGRVPLSALPRIDAIDRSASLDWTAIGSDRGRHGTLRLDLGIEGAVELTCQRCLQPMTEHLKLSSRFLVAGDEASADHLDQDDEFDVVVGSEDFDLDGLIEDEVILALPIAPRHAVCPHGAGDLPSGARRPSPFAALAGLRIAPDTEGPDDPKDDGAT